MKLLLLMLLITGCGAANQKTHNKTYTLSLDKDASTQARQKFEVLIREFNELGGQEYITYTDNPEEADSLITLNYGLRDRESKLGLGQWITKTKDNIVEYSMRLQFDKGYIVHRLNSEIGSQRHYELQKLVWHEIGHGLQMSHHTDREHVMYREISGNKKLESFFVVVRRFFEGVTVVSN